METAPNQKKIHSNLVCNKGSKLKDCVKQTVKRPISKVIFRKLKANSPYAQNFAF